MNGPNIGQKTKAFGSKFLMKLSKLYFDQKYGFVMNTCFFFLSNSIFKVSNPATLTKSRGCYAGFNPI